MMRVSVAKCKWWDVNDVLNKKGPHGSEKLGTEGKLPEGLKMRTEPSVLKDDNMTVVCD